MEQVMNIVKKTVLNQTFEKYARTAGARTVYIHRTYTGAPRRSKVL